MCVKDLSGNVIGCSVFDVVQNMIDFFCMLSVSVFLVIYIQVLGDIDVFMDNIFWLCVLVGFGFLFLVNFGNMLVDCDF